MKRLLPVFFAALLCSGFVLPETPEQRAAQERRHREWATVILDRYDTAALTRFLKKVIEEQKRWEDANLAQPKLEAKWVMGGSVMVSGDWHFSSRDPKGKEFILGFTFNEQKRRFWMSCVRKSEREFEVREMKCDDVIVLIL